LNRLRPALSSHWGQHVLICPVGISEPLRQRWVTRMMAMLIRALMKPHTSEYGFSHFSERADSFLRRSLDSFPIMSSVERSNRVKCPCCSRHGLRYFFFFSRSCAARTFMESLVERLDLASKSVILASMIQSVPRAQSLPINKSSRSSFQFLR
jgi:hypothetical protein